MSLSPDRDQAQVAETINLYAAKTNLSALVERAAAGEEIIIAKAGRPLARLVPLATTQPGKRPLGLMRGQIWIGDDFDDPLPQDIQDVFDGKCP
jgi:prevent-host-death family protein